ncbi:TRAP transporter small permease [Acuticoccus sp. MNP-M23]|uniref:TRAP transporter small permease n=1 Tax=Acuticoccus sp. MNP-M23 TaxID=3072793 RepID=UPI00281622F7|nr:TRAP transporter small permease [Acuticoccus sp. MNP-M23]WMS41594.1 TRAP transporter small permease [Acuticoccus sp. MNP-M23]
MRKLTTALALLGTSAFLVAVVLTVIDIVLRSVSTLTVHGLTDIVTLCTMIGALMAIPYGFAHDEHVSIDVFTVRLPAGVQRACALFAALLGLVFLAGATWFASQQMLMEWGYGDRSQSIGIPMVYYWLPLLIGLGIAALANLWLIVRILRGITDTAQSVEADAR